MSLEIVTDRINRNRFSLSFHGLSKMWQKGGFSVFGTAQAREGEGGMAEGSDE